jgi:Conjugative transposon protein TcpC
MTRSGSHPTVTITPRPMWRIRLTREAPRYLLQALAVMGIVASARFAIAPPRPVIVRSSTPRALLPDRAAEGFASLFARRYLTWDSADPEAHARALASYFGAGAESDDGMQPPSSGAQRVQWTEVVQARVPAPGEHVYTVAAQTDTAGLVYLTVSVARQANGSLALAGYPAFVGAPSLTPATAPAQPREVQEPALRTVVERALRNYLAGSASELDADLANGARVSLPGIALSLQQLRSLDWSPDGRSALAVVQASDERGAQYTLAYELDVSSQEGRWEVSAIQMDPTT